MLAACGAVAIHAVIRHGLAYFKWGLIATVLAGLGVWLYIDRHVDDEIRRQAEAWLAARFPQLEVSVDSARLVDGEGITLRGVHLRTRGPEAEASELAAIDEVAIDCDTSLQRLMQGDVNIRRMVVRRPRLRLARMGDGSWNISQLLAGTSGNATAQPPSTEIEGGILELIDGSRQPAARWTLRDVNLALDASQGGDGHLRVAGTLAGDHLRQAEVKLDYQAALRTAGATIELAGVEISPALLAALPREAAEHAGALAALQARADVKLELAYASGQAQPWRFDARVQVREGRLEHPRLAYPLGQLQAKIHVHDGGLEIEELTANNRQTTLQLAAKRRGWLPTSPLDVHVVGKQIVFDQRMLDALPPAGQEIWSEFRPEGEADVDARLTFDGSSWHPDVTVTARSLAVTYFRFPYQVQQGSGWLKLVGKELSFRMTGKARGVPVQSEGQIHDFGPAGAGWVQVSGQKLRSDPDMIAAMSPESRAIVEAFRPSAGVFDLDLRLWWQPHDPVVHRQMQLRIRSLQGRYERFRYGLANISGVVEQLGDDEWRFSDLKATNGQGRITCWGSMKPEPANVGRIANPSGPTDGPSPASTAQDHLLDLHFTGDNIALDDELQGALPPEMRGLWTNLKPRGLVNLDDVTFQFRTRQRTKRLSLSITPREESVSVEPAAFPYRWEKLRGQISYQDGVVHWRNLQATHGDTAWRSDGQANVAADGGWGLSLTGLTVDRLHVDRDLLRAAPEGLRRVLTELNPTGAFNLHGGVSFAQAGGAAQPLHGRWDLDVICHRNGLQAGVKLDDLFGIIHLEGQSERGEARMSGQLALESLSCRGFQFTQVQGPFTVQPGLILWGSPHEPQLQAGPGHISARCYEGVLIGDAWVRRSEAAPASPARGEAAASASWKFFLRANLAQASLGRFCREAVIGRQNISGRADGNVVLHGSSQGVRDLRGAGNVRLRDANLYELPVMLSLLKVLSLKEPDLTAFTTSDVEFAINGAHGQVYFPRIDLNGDALSLSGRGSVGFNRQLALAFRPQLGSSRSKVPILGDLLRSASGQIVELYVGGTADQPEVHREPFPDIKEALENLQAAPILPNMTPAPSTLRPNFLGPRR